MVQAQYGYITGKVYDRFGPIANAPVYIQDSPYGSFTNDQGYFAFEIDTGYYQLVVELTGYAKEVRNIELNNLERKELDLELSNNLLDANVSIGTKSIESQKLMEAPVPIDLILGEDLLNTGEVELGPALHQILPNFYSVKQSADDGVNMIDPVSLRGLGPDQLLVLINGKRRHKSAFLNVSDVFGKGTAGPDLNAIPILSIEKIEILRDGASSQYGSDAIAGVMNIILKE
ncbi:MAG TPA: TonB-dependent receptor, partial [Cytophagales bacterium]|nr:TonB-dependent receptor [Cytophagales bacterium]